VCSTSLRYQQFQLRFCPTLAKKPVPKTDTTPKKKIDPFQNPTGNLFISNIPKENSSHVLVLNKFPIIPNHFILATKEYKEQTDPLEASDLEATLACLKAWQEGAPQKQLYAFFNSGTHSGASQPHRHIQFLPVEDMARDDITGEWQLLMSSIVNLKSVPMMFFQENISDKASPQELHTIYLRLLASCRGAWDKHASKAKLPAEEFSYNIGMTTSTIVMCPRTQEGVTLRKDDGTEIGYVALNGTLTGATLMVKQPEEWEYLRNTPSVIDRILEGIGVPARIEKIRCG
jgi:ATP adenylyltransferase